MKLSTLLDPLQEQDYDINTITQDEYHRYQYCDGIMYRLSGNPEEELGIDQIEATPENSFYPDQIEQYKDYIRDGGILDTFPVQATPLAYTIKDMLYFLDDLERGSTLESEADWILYHEYPFLKDNWFSLSDLLEFEGLNPKARSPQELFPEGMTPEAQQLMKELIPVFSFFKTHKEYTLTDMNHRFEAVRQLGKSKVLAEMV